MHSKRTWWRVTSALLAALGAILVEVASVRSQALPDLPLIGAYKPILNFTGVGAGLQFRNAINDSSSRVKPILPMVVGSTFASLPAEHDGLMLLCQDCKRTTPRTNGGSGAWALGTRGQWSCSGGPLEANLNANGNTITALANGTTTRNALAFGQTSGGDLGVTLPDPTLATVLGGKTLAPNPLLGDLAAGSYRLIALARGSVNGEASAFGQTGAQLNTLAGARHDGSDALTGFTVNGINNVKAYGATGLGLADDTAAIQAAIAAACVSHSTGFAGNDNGAQVFLPPGYYLHSYPIWVNCNGLSLAGSGSTFASSLGPTYDFGPAIVVVGGGYVGMPMTTSLVTGLGTALDFTRSQLKYYLNLSEWDGVNGPLGSPSGMHMNGLSAFTVEAFVKDVTAGDGGVVTSSGTPNSIAGFVEAFGISINSGAWFGQLKTTTASYANFGSAVSLGANTFVILQYTGSHYCIYNCTPGAKNCAVTGSGTATGRLVQNPLEDVVIGPSAGTNPNGAREGASINGYIDSVRISNVARYSASGGCDTIAAVPNAKLAQDANTLILTNGETPNSEPFVKAYDGAGGYGWLFPYNSDYHTGGASLSRVSIGDLGIEPTRFKDVSGVITDAMHDSQIGPLWMYPNIEVGVEAWNLSFENHFHDINSIGNGRYGIVNNGADNEWDYTKLTGYWACQVFPSSGSLINPVCVDGSGGRITAYGLLAPPGASPTIDLYSPWDDFENAGTVFKAGIFGSSIGTLSVYGGQLSASNGAPILWLDNSAGATATITGTALSTVSGVPTQIVKSTGAAGKVVLTNPRIVGAWGSSPLSLTVGVVTMTPCKGMVTLSSGAGTFSNVCVTTSSNCQARDKTTPANTVTLGVPTNGSVTLSGTRTDSIVLSCY